MNKKKYGTFVVLTVLIVAVVFICFDSKLISRVRQTVQKPGNTQTAGTYAESLTEQAETAVGDNSITDSTSEILQVLNGNIESEALIKSETVFVSNNTPEYELEMKLCENSGKKTFIRLKYYINGASTVNELDEGDLPELAELFESREKEKNMANANANAFIIGQALLNPVYSQLYMLIQGAPLGAYTQASFYMLNLQDMSLKKLFSYPGLYGKMAFNKDYRLLAYSFGDPPLMSMYQEDNLLEVFDCANSEYIVKGSRDEMQNIIGKNSVVDYLYDYEFEGWQSINTLKLRQAMRPIKEPDAGLAQIEMLYDIEKNLLLNLDGSELKAMTADSNSQQANTDTNSHQANSESEKTGTESNINAETVVREDSAIEDPIKVLKSFYSYLAAEKDYVNAMQRLDSSFKLRLNMLKQFGVEEILKNDIDSENASAYSELLKAAKFDTIVEQVTKDGVCTVTYYHILGLNADSQIRQLMTAELKRVDKLWKITLIEEQEQ